MPIGRNARATWRLGIVSTDYQHAFPDNEHNRAYLRTKAAKAGHLL
jgi:GTP cyclohydrolase II